MVVSLVYITVVYVILNKVVFIYYPCRAILSLSSIIHYKTC